MGPEIDGTPRLCCTLLFFGDMTLFHHEQAEEVSLSGSTFTVRFPASSGDLLYDPTLELILTPGDEDEFWRHPWFVWSAGSLGALVRAT